MGILHQPRFAFHTPRNSVKKSPAVPVNTDVKMTSVRICLASLLWAHAAIASGLAVEKSINGAPVLTEDGAVVSQHSFSANLYENETTREEVRKAGTHGINLVFERGLCESVDAGDGSFVVNTAILDEGIQNLLADNPHARIIVKTGGLHPPTSWHNYHSKATKLKSSTGTFHAMPDPNSAIYLNAAANYLQGVVEHVESQPYAPSVVGYRIALFEGSEFMLPAGYYGYSDATQSAFREFLSQRYVTLDNLRSAWNDPSISSFDAVTVPPPSDFAACDLGAFRNPVTHRKVIDFTEFWQEANANCLLLLCRSIKEASSRHPLVGAFYGYILETGQAFYKGHHALRKVLDSPLIDYLSAPYSYVYRAQAWNYEPDADIGAGAFHGPVDSILANGKIFFTEDDSRTYLTTDDTKKSHFPDLAGTVANLRRNQLASVCRGAGMWQLDLNGTGWYNSQELMQEIGLQKRMEEFLLGDANHTAGYTPDVALIIDEDSSFYVSTRSTTDASQKISISMFLRDHLCRAGINYGVYLLSDLVAGRVPDCSTYIFAGTYFVSRTERNWIDETLKKDGKILVWLHGSGLYDESGRGLDRMSGLVGLDIAQDSLYPCPNSIEPSDLFSSVVANPPENDTGIGGQPEWYVQTLPPEAQVIGNYDHGTIQHPAIVLANMGEWKTVYAGTLSFDPTWLLGLIRMIGTHQYLDSNSTVPCYAGNGIIGIWPTTSTTGTVRLKEPSDVYDLYTGRLLFEGTTGFPVSLQQWEVRGFKTLPTGTPWMSGRLYQWQTEHFQLAEITSGLADSGTDPDSDGDANYREFLAGSDPRDPLSKLKLYIAAAGQPDSVHLSFNTSVGRVYRIHSTANLVQGPWVPVVAIQGTGADVAIPVPFTPPSAFFRLEAEYP